MNLYGWFFLIVSWAFIITLAGFCFYKVFTEKDDEI